MILQIPARPACLVILDGVGYRAESEGNAVAAADTPFLDHAFAHFPWVLLEPGGEAVGLPVGQMGNSEVGHLNLGAGRVVYQELTRINRAIAAGELETHPVLREWITAVEAEGGSLHLIGLCSPGGVHSQIEHLLYLIELLPRLTNLPVWLQLLTDGRDTPPASGLADVQRIEAALAGQQLVRIASVGGRYHAMDRDQRWERLERAYRVLVDGAAEVTAPSASIAVRQSYAAGVTDEFIVPTRINWPERAPLEGCIQPGDGVLCFNFRADRMRQLVASLIRDEFPHFARPHHGPHHVVSFTRYDESFPVPVLFPPQDCSGGLVEFLSGLGFGIFKIAETEKYAHVTYFFNGGVEAPFPHEDRVLIPSPKVATYDLQPAMSAPEVTAVLTERIRSGTDMLIVCNYANGDMVGHTGNFAAAVEAMTVLDRCLAEVAAACQERGMVLVITADHGNCEEMLRPGTAEAMSTQHSLGPVPFIVCDPAIKLRQGTFALSNVAPTVLGLMGIPAPPQMTAEPLLGSAAVLAEG